MSNAYSASDYAGLSGGEWSFYYGYESAEQDSDEEPGPWMFTASGPDVFKMKRTAAQLGCRQFDDPARVLLVGIALALDVHSTSKGENGTT
jgi:hypothetical protein